jgi:hypothetical protein
MTIYSDLANAKTDINTNIGSQTSARAITPTVHAGVLDNVVETVFQYSAGTGVDTLREALLDSGLTFLYEYLSLKELLQIIGEKLKE